jgi:hypothetical protein
MLGRVSARSDVYIEIALANDFVCEQVNKSILQKETLRRMLMLGSLISKRWVVSFALVGLVSLFMASYAAVWTDPASAGSTGGTVSGQILTNITISPNSLNVAAGTSSAITVTPIDDDENVDLTMPGIIYTWNSGSCGTFANATTTGVTNTFTAVDATCSGTITVHGNQNSGANVPSSGVSIGVQVTKAAAVPPAPVFTASDDGPVNAGWDTQEEIDSVMSAWYGGGSFAAKVVLPSQSSAITDPSGNSLSISSGSLDSGDSKVAAVVPITLTDLQAPPPAAKTGSTSGTFRFGSSAIQIEFYDASDSSSSPGKITLNKPAQVCMTVTQADIDGAYGGPDGVKIWHYNGDKWVALSTTLLIGNPSKVCAYTSSFSPFAVGLDVAPPEAGEEVATGLPVTGDYAPGVNGLVIALMSGIALVFTGAFTIRRSRRARENS